MSALIIYPSDQSANRSGIESVLSNTITTALSYPSAYDSDAQAYFTAVETAGGSFDLSGIDPTYTESYVKTAHSNFYAGLKADGLWGKLTEFYLLAGKTFGGLTVKGKGTGSLTNNNFVSGDWLGAGSGAGLTGNGSSKYLDTGLLDSSLSADDKSFGVYVTLGGADSYQGLMMAESGTDSWGVIGTPTGDNNTRQARIPNSDAPVYGTSGVQTGLFTGSRRGVNDVEVYENGLSVATDTSTASATNATVSYYLFSRNDDGVSELFSNATLTFAHAGTGLTDTDASNLSTRVNTLMTSLGCNVY